MNIFIDDKDIRNMQDKAKLIRQTLEISINDFAAMLGVTRQTVYNIENHKKLLTQTQYLAMRTIIDMALAQQPEKDEVIKAILKSNYRSATSKEARGL